MKDQQSKQVIEVINTLTRDGVLDILYKAGFLASKTTMYRDIYLKYQSYLAQGFARKKAVEAVASHFKYEDERTVYRAISSMSAIID